MREGRAMPCGNVNLDDRWMPDDASDNGAVQWLVSDEDVVCLDPLLGS